MKKAYVAPQIEFESYSLTTQIAGACKDDANKTPIGEVAPITLNGKTVHCVVYPNGETKNCSEGAHTWQIKMDGTIFADGNKVGGCDHDVYSLEDYVDLLVKSLASSGSTISGKDMVDYFSFKGASAQHTGSIEGADYYKYFKS